MYKHIFTLVYVEYLPSSRFGHYQDGRGVRIWHWIDNVDDDIPSELLVSYMIIDMFVEKLRIW